jgi:DNA-binding transcriptional LysR family regulator
MKTARETLEHLGKRGGGRLRIGASTTACQNIIPPVLREFKESFPEHAITIEPGDTPELVDALLQNRIDLALTLASSEPQLEFHPLFTDELNFIVAALHGWAKAGRVERSQIPRQNYILYNKHSLTFRLIEDYFRREEMVLNTVVEMGSLEATKELVKLGIGVSILALPLGRRKLQCRWGILHLRGKRLDLAQETFIGLCESATALLSRPVGES